MKVLRTMGLALIMALLVATGCSSGDDDTAADGTTTTVAAAAPASSETTTTTAAPPDTTAAEIVEADGTDDCLVGLWESSPEGARQWASDYATALRATDPVASEATITIDSAAFSSEFRADGTGTNTSLVAGTAEHPLGTGAATLQSTSEFEWLIEGGQLVFTYISGTVNNEVTVSGVSVPFAGAVPASGETSTVPYSCSDTTLQADFAFGGLATATPEMQRSF
ncbi:MAG: hypothetical protein AAF962_27265 [Actinomycetota bacterium]